MHFSEPCNGVTLRLDIVNFAIESFIQACLSRKQSYYLRIVVSLNVYCFVLKIHVLKRIE
mgnify:CR=1 FL=1